MSGLPAATGFPEAGTATGGAGLEEGLPRTVLDNITDGVIAIDNKGTVRLFNSAAQRMFEYLDSDVLGKNIDLLIPSFHGSRDGETVREVQVCRKNGAALLSPPIVAYASVPRTVLAKPR